MEEIQQLRDSLLKNLEKEKNWLEYFEKFDRVDSPRNRVNYVMQLLEKYDLLHDFMRGKTLRASKQASLCQKYLDQAKETAKHPQNKVLTISLVNRAFCYANAAAEILLPEAYALKAHIYQERGEYKKTLSVINVARNHELCPLQLRVDLTVKEFECRSWLKPEGAAQTERQDDEDEYKLAQGARADMPILSNTLNPYSVGGPNNYKIFSGAHIKKDDVVAIEEPFCLHITSNNRFFVCHNCTKEVVLPVTCSNCTSVLFCSENCKTEAIQDFHGVECSVIDFLTMILDDFHYPALRLSFAFLSMFYPSTKQAMKFFKNPGNKSDLFLLEYSKFTKQDYYKVINTWKKNPDKDNLIDRITTALIVAVTTNVLFAHTPLREYLSKKKDRDFFMDLLYYHIEIVPHNLEAVIKVLDNFNGRLSEEIIGMGVYGLQKYFSTMSEPSLRKKFSGGQCIYIANRNIPPGNILCVEPPIYETHEDSKLAPVLDDKILDNTLRYNEVYEIPRRLTLRDNFRLFFHDHEFAATTIDHCSALLERFESFYPCYQIMTAEHCLWLGINILLESIPIDERIDMLQ